MCPTNRSRNDGTKTQSFIVTLLSYWYYLRSKPVANYAVGLQGVINLPSSKYLKVPITDMTPYTVSEGPNVGNPSLGRKRPCQTRPRSHWSRFAVTPGYKCRIINRQLSRMLSLFFTLLLSLFLLWIFNFLCPYSWFLLHE